MPRALRPGVIQSFFLVVKMLLRHALTHNCDMLWNTIVCLQVSLQLGCMVCFLSEIRFSRCLAVQESSLAKQHILQVIVTVPPSCAHRLMLRPERLRWAHVRLVQFAAAAMIVVLKVNCSLHQNIIFLVCPLSHQLPTPKPGNPHGAVFWNPKLHGKQRDNLAKQQLEALQVFL